MKNPTSKGDGTTGAWKAFSSAYNRVGGKAAGNRRKKYENLKKFKNTPIKKFK
jgi:hypothetical protein